MKHIAAEPGARSNNDRAHSMCGGGNEGVMEREYQQIYAINDPGLFKSCPQVEFQSENAQHLKHMLELPGVHRAWQLQHEPYAGQIGPDPAGEYMNLYEIDAPENIFDPSLGEDRLPLKAGQKFAGRHFAQLLLKTEELP